MKAWFVWASEEWGDYVHGATASKAKAMFWKTWSYETEEWIYMRAIRVRDLDNIPITSKSIASVSIVPDDWDSICDCEICEMEV